MAGSPDELHETTKLDIDHVWDGSRAIESLVVYLELQIDDRLGSLDQ